MLLLRYSLENIKYDIIGLAEVRRNGNNIIEDEEHIFCHTGESKGLYGVGFLIKKKYKNNIENYVGITERVCLLNLNFVTTKLSLIQVYAPTSDATEEVLDAFYDQVEKARCLATGKVILLGDWNAKIGKRKLEENTIIGPYCYGERNHRGQKLVQYALQNKLTIINTIFKKKIKNLWTWISPDEQNKNQIDFILSNHPKLFTNIEVLNKLSFPSDHRLLRGTITLNTKKSRATFNLTPTINLSDEKSQEIFLHALNTKVERFSWEDNDDIESYYSKIESSIQESLKNTTPIKIKKEIISEETKKLIKKRTDLQHKPSKSKEEKKELSELFKITNKQLRKEYNKYRIEIIEKHLHATGSQRKAYKQLNAGKKWIPTLKTKNKPKEQQTRKDLVKIASNFYEELYDGKCTDNKNYEKSSETGDSNQEIQPFHGAEIIKRIEKLKKEKSPGADNIPNEALILGRHILLGPLTTLFNKILENQEIPINWARSRIILLYKKGDPEDINNYRPISLLPTIYKLFAMCVEKRIEPTIEKNQPAEQAGFRQGYSTIDHIHTLDQIIEKHVEYQQKLYIAYIDYAKAFDSISHKSIWDALEQQNLQSTYINIIKDIYRKSTSRVKLDRQGPEFNIRRGVKQGDPLSPKIFIAVLQNIMKDLRWDKKGINIDGNNLSNLRFADDIVLFAKSSKQLQEMLIELNVASENIGLQLNTSKTKIATNSTKDTIIINQTTIEYVESYKYLGKEISFQSTRHLDEIERRINMTWKKYWSNKEILKSKLPITLKKKVMDSNLLPCLTYGAQTWIFNKKNMSKIRTCQRAMERSILGIKIMDKQNSAKIRQKTKVIDALQHALRLKWKWAGHIARSSADRWAKRATTWKGPGGPGAKRKKGRPTARWVDDIPEVAGGDWMKAATDRKKWRQLEEAYTRKGP